MTAMSAATLSAPAATSAAPRFLPLLLLLFAGSGCAALIYEIVWFQLMQLVIGSSAVSLAVLLGTFMGGMCLGSLALPRLISPHRHPLRVYAALEAGLGVLGVVALFVMPYVGGLYGDFAGHGLPSFLLRGLVCAACLLPPTLLMGATLPAIARWIETTPQGISWLGFFYGGNIAGAVFGCLLAGFYLLRVHDMETATYVAASLNGAVALLALGLSRLTPHRPPDVAARYRPARTRGARSVYIAIAISGATALAAEVVWTRLLALLLGGTVYTFSIILAVFLVGLGVGSGAGALLARVGQKPRMLFGVCQLLLAAAVAWAALMLAASLPYWPINTYLSRSPWLTFQLDLVRCLWAVLPAACLWGASFPLALAASATRGQDPGRLVGGMYAANTVGAIFGSVVASLFLIPGPGTQRAQQVLVGLSALAALVVLVPALWSLYRSALIGRCVAGAMVLAVCIAGAGFLAWGVPETPWELIAFGRNLPNYVSGWKSLYMGEGMNSSIAVTEQDNGVRNFHVSGKVEASSQPQDMRLQRMLGHIPAMLHPRPRSVLVVGFGAGVTAGSFVVHPEVHKIVICELEPLIPREVAPHFSKENHDVVNDQRVEIVYDDARHHVLTTPRQFDIITSDPIHPWVKGSATLYTREYFELCKRRLKPGGLISQWVPLYESDLDVVKSEIATFFEVFPHGTIWCNDQENGGYDLVLLGQAGPLQIDADAVQRRLERTDHADVLRSLNEIGYHSVIGLLAKYGGRAGDLRGWLQDAEINHDRNLRLQYLAGMGLNLNQGRRIQEELMSHRRFPEDVFVGKGRLTEFIRIMLTQPTAKRP
jgi:spermidine synthase